VFDEEGMFWDEKGKKDGGSEADGGDEIICCLLPVAGTAIVCDSQTRNARRQ
jgi:hypothetical protein